MCDKKKLNSSSLNILTSASTPSASLKTRIHEYVNNVHFKTRYIPLHSECALEVFKFPHYHSGKCTYWITTEVKIGEIFPVPEHRQRRFKEGSTEKLSLLTQMNKTAFYRHCSESQTPEWCNGKQNTCELIETLNLTVVNSAAQQIKQTSHLASFSNRIHPWKHKQRWCTITTHLIKGSGRFELSTDRCCLLDKKAIHWNISYNRVRQKASRWWLQS